MIDKIIDYSLEIFIFLCVFIGVVIILALAFHTVALQSDLKTCREHGYSDLYITWTDWYCIKIEDGNEYVVPVDELE